MKNKLPVHTRLGGFFCRGILIILALFMLKNCVSAVYFGRKTSNQEMARSYAAGYARGSEDGEYIGDQPEKNTRENPLVRKSYLQGFRDGRDSKVIQGKQGYTTKGKQ